MVQPQNLLFAQGQEAPQSVQPAQLSATDCNGSSHVETGLDAEGVEKPSEGAVVESQEMQQLKAELTRLRDFRVPTLMMVRSDSITTNMLVSSAHTRFFDMLWWTLRVLISGMQSG